jgi:hypothetical protein
MATKNVCDYCGKELSEQELFGNKGVSNGYRLVDACDKCFKEVRKIEKKYSVFFTELREKMDKELKGLKNKEVKKNKFWSLWK